MRRAFTAIELVVVLVIIAIIAVMLIPALEGGRHQAQVAKCLSRMRQVGLAIEMYQNAHDSYWPDCRRSASPEFPDSPDPTASLAALYPRYAPKPFLFQCPATHDVVMMEPDGEDFMNCSNFYVGPSGEITRPEDKGKGPPRPPSYFFDGGGRYERCIPRSPKPNRVVYGDECMHGFWADRDGDREWLGENNHPTGGGNFMFADKHAEWFKIQWSGDPYDIGDSIPMLPNPRLRSPARLGKPLPYEVWVDTDVFWDNYQGKRKDVDADLAGMMWVDGSWKEF